MCVEIETYTQELKKVYVLFKKTGTFGTTRLPGAGSVVKVAIDNFLT